jgi:hypothetical protein
MSDLTPDEQQLLGFACAAAGRAPYDVDEHGAWFHGEADPIIGAWSNFNPLHRNGDAFALMVQLQLAAEIADSLQAYAASATGHHWTELVADHPDHASALRRAVTACAALVGGWQP